MHNHPFSFHTKRKRVIFLKKHYEDRHRPLSTDDNQKDIVVPEEFPDGPFGSAIRKHDPVERKSTKWRKSQQSISAYTYYDKDQHDDLPRRMPSSHPLHDE